MDRGSTGTIVALALVMERVHIPDSPLDLTTSIRFRGTPTVDGTLAEASVPSGRCAQRLVECLRDTLPE